MTQKEEPFLTVINNSPKPQIRVEAFKTKYLPLLISNPDPSVFNIRWIDEVAMSPYLEVDAINNDGTVAFTIPPLRSQVNTVVDATLQQVANLAKMEYQVHHLKGHAFLNTNLPRVLRFNSARDADIQKRWNELLILLGYKDLLVDPDTGTTADRPVQKTVEMSDDEDWD